LDSILAGALNLGVIAGGPQAVASVATGGDGVTTGIEPAALEFEA